MHSRTCSYLQFHRSVQRLSLRTSKNTATGTHTNTAMAAINATTAGTPAANERVKVRPLTALTGLSEANKLALSGAPENNQHNKKNATPAAPKEITPHLFMQYPISGPSNRCGPVTTPCILTLPAKC